MRTKTPYADIARLQAEVEALRTELSTTRAELDRLMDANVIIECHHPELDAVEAELSTTRQQFGDLRDEAQQLRSERDYIKNLYDRSCAIRDAMLPVVEAAKAWIKSDGVHREDEYEALAAAVDALSTPPPDYPRTYDAAENADWIRRTFEADISTPPPGEGE